METSDRQIILIVDDSKENVRVLAQLFTMEYTVKIALTAKEALRVAESDPQPDIILLDIMMPDMNGYEVCEQLKKSQHTSDIPVIFVSAMDQDADEAKGLNLGAIDYVVKPIRPAIVKARVRNHLELKRLRDLLHSQSMLDGLTGLNNRRRFDEALLGEWNRALRNQRPLTLMILDIDYFKKYNDTYGHLAGDDCLKTVAQTMKRTLRRSQDLVARWGGEEFVCLMPEADLDTGRQLAEQLRSTVEATGLEHRSSPVAGVVTVSIGVASVLPSAATSLEGLLAAADELLYKAKNGGRNRVESRLLATTGSV